MNRNANSFEKCKCGEWKELGEYCPCKTRYADILNFLRFATPLIVLMILIICLGVLALDDFGVVNL
jgi:hypothetical protein